MAEQSGGSRKNSHSQVVLLVDQWFSIKKLPILLFLLLLLLILNFVNLNEAIRENSNLPKSWNVHQKRHLLLQPVGRLNPINQQQDSLLLKDLSRRKGGQLKLSHRILCEPISQLNDLKIVCPNDNQFIVILEAYYSDLYPEIVCPKANSETKLNKLTGSQLVSIFKQLYSNQDNIESSSSFKNDQKQQQLIRFNPTLSYGSQIPFCLDDLKQSFQAKCSGRQRCSFSRHTDHQFPNCVNLKPGHVFARYLCIDDALLVKYCNADELLASHTSVASRVKRFAPTNYDGSDEDSEISKLTQRDKRQLLFSDLPVQLDPSEQEAQIDTLDFGFVASPGYPIFYATPTNSDSYPKNYQEQGGNNGGESIVQPASSNCGWTIEAELGQRITVKLLDASLAPNEKLLKGLANDGQDDYSTSNSLFPLFENAAAASGGDTTSGASRQQTSSNNNLVTPALVVGDSVVIASVATSSLTFPSSLTSSASSSNKPTSQELNKRMSANTSNVYFETINQDNLNTTTNYKFTNPSNKRIVFKIDEYDYEIIKTNLVNKLQQVAAQCQDYDQLILRDSSFSFSNVVVDSSSTKQTTTTTNGYNSNTSNSEEFELISKLPITLYKNHLINFSNHSIYHKLSNPSSGDNNNDNDDYLKHMLYKRIIKSSSADNGQEQERERQLTDRRIDYQALLSTLNPLQLVWLYQHNVTLCSTSQLDQLSSPQQKNKISFTSTGNTITLDLVSGHMFNPNNRGILFWYHKHGCPATLKIPHRTRLIFRNETTEVFQCFDGFVFNDTRKNVRIRQCNQEDQNWYDTGNFNINNHYDHEDNNKNSGNLNEGKKEDKDDNTHSNQIPPCVYIEDFTNSNNIKLDKLVESNNHGLTKQNSGQHRINSNGNDVAVEVVGVTTPDTNLYPDLQNEIDIFSTNNPQMSASQSNNNNNKNAKQTNSSFSGITSLWNNMLEYMTLSEQDSDGTRSIMTHQPLKEQRITTTDKDSSFWLKIGALFDKRLLAPAIAVLFLFILINLIIYVIFLVALPKFARLLCSKSGLTNSRHLSKNRDGTMSSKFSHYESDYSVTMGMSL